MFKTIIHGGALRELLQKDRHIPKAHLKKICRTSEPDACRYASAVSAPDATGFYCSKNTSVRLLVDGEVAAGRMTATGDNCEGLGEVKKASG